MCMLGEELAGKVMEGKNRRNGVVQVLCEEKPNVTLGVPLTGFFV